MQSIWQACERIAGELGAPLIIENVRGAARYMGNPQAKYGAYWIWGDVPLLLPVGKGIHKGFTRQEKKYGDGVTQFGGNAYHFSRGESAKTGSNSKARKEWSAKIAMIPYPLSRYIGEYFMKEYRESLLGKHSRKRSRNG